MANQWTAFRLREMPRLAGLAVLYFLIAHATNSYFAAIGMEVAVIRPNSGFALGALLLLGTRYWPAIFLGTFVARLELGFSVPASALVALGTSMGAVLGTWLLNRGKAFDPSMPSLNDFFRLVLLAGIAGIAVSALTGTLALVQEGKVGGKPFSVMMLRWCMGDTLGILMVAPLLLVWKQPPRHWLRPGTGLEAALCLILSFLVGQTVFLGWFHASLGVIARGYWLFLFVAWGAARLGAQGVVLILNMVMIQSLWGAAQGVGFFGTDIAQTQLSNFWFYVLILTIVCMGLASTVNAFKKAEQEVRHLAHHDPLTGLANRLLLTDRIHQAIARAKREKRRMAIIFHDLDNFKPVNDCHGHLVGDFLLREVARRVQACVRESDTVGRIGGDEFVIVLPVAGDAEDALLVARKIHDALLVPFEVEGHVLKISTSIGVALYPEHGLDESALIINADNAMYFAKASGRNTIQLYSPEMPRMGRGSQGG